MEALTIEKQGENIGKVAHDGDDCDASIRAPHTY